jgi:DNA-binding transcriptional ArsR family regulator
MDWETAAQGFAAMGSEPRLQVLKVLVRAGEEGLTVSEIQERTGLAPSTLAHHLKFMAAAGLIRQKKAGRTVFSHARLDHLEDLANFVLSECCADQQRRAANDG